MNAIEYLQRLLPEREWLLAAIWPERGEKPTDGLKSFEPLRAPFDGKQVKNTQTFVGDHNGTRGLYYRTFTLVKPGKVQSSNIGAVYFLHVDVDARAGHDLVSELERIWRLLADERPSGVPEPTVINLTGGGAQALWKLDEPVHVMGHAEEVERIAEHNKWLSDKLGGDSCHDPLHLLRLPGTVNVPNRDKVARGRVRATAENRVFNDNSYPLSTFGLISVKPKPRGTTLTEPQGIVSVRDLNVDDRTKLIICEGRVPWEPPKEPRDTRSEWLFDGVCQMVRQNVPEETILGVLTDCAYRADYVTGARIPDGRGGYQRAFRIAESVIEKPDPLKYARRQIDSARDTVESPTLAEMNEKHAVIGNLGGKCLVVEEVVDEVLGRARLVKQTFDTIRNRYLNRFEEVVENDKFKRRPLGDWWLKHPNRRYYDRLVFVPGREIDGCYNLWQSFKYKPEVGSLHESYLRHLNEVICDGNDVLYQYLIHWMARSVQYPAEAGHTAVVLRGAPGTGKSFFIKKFGDLFGRHFLHLQSPAHLTGTFNSHLRDGVLVFGDEIFHSGDKAHEAKLKTLITEEMFMVEAKGIDAEATPNFVHLMLATNEDWAVPVGFKDRRFFIIDVSDKWALCDDAPAEQHRARKAYFDAIENDLKAGGFAHLLHYLLHLDLGEFDVRRIPHTSAKAEHEAASDPVSSLIVETLQSGGIDFPTVEIGENTRCFRAAWLRECLSEPVRVVKVGQILGALGLVSKVVQGNKYWILDDDLVAARERFKLRIDWDTATTEWANDPRTQVSTTQTSPDEDSKPKERL